MMLLAVAVIAVGIFALPSTISLFAGQHTWYNLTGNQSVPCEKCHADVANEMGALIGPHTGETGFQRMKCGFCHRTFPIENEDINQTYKNYEYTYGSVGDAVTDVTPGKESHAASTVPCMYCHSGYEYGHSRRGYPEYLSTGHPITYAGMCTDCHPGVHGGVFYDSSDVETNECVMCHGNRDTGEIYEIPPAGGFGLTAEKNDTGELAAHKTFIEKSIEDTKMEDANEACIACHTHIPVKINWTHRYSLEFNCTPEFEKLPPTHFNVTAWSINGTYNITVYGWRNGTGNISKEDWPGSYP
ncbi:MAG: hypothetical protein OCU16_02625 [Candidatus Methanospirare jalkutatii]|nr:hypothetical protein [Candidatus Methanospirare jalkutatii]